MKTIIIDFLYLDLNTCERCVSTDDVLNSALEKLSPIFNLLNIEVKVNKVKITNEKLARQYHFISSPTIRVNGIDICDELKESDCKNCGEICGESTDCRVFVFNDKEYEQPPASMIIDGILRIIYGNKPDNEYEYSLPENLNKFFKKKEFNMKKMKIYEPAMCCSTGLCGASIDPELLRISTVINNLGKKGIKIERYNLSSAPQEFMKNSKIGELLNKEGINCLPLTMLDNEIVLTNRYPTNEEIAKFLEIPADFDGKPKKSNCCHDGGCC